MAASQPPLSFAPTKEKSMTLQEVRDLNHQKAKDAQNGYEPKSEFSPPDRQPNPAFRGGAQGYDDHQQPKARLPLYDCFMVLGGGCVALFTSCFRGSKSNR